MIDYDYKRPDSLEEVFRRADVVSLHTPKLPETLGMIRGSHFAVMKPGATFINTAPRAVLMKVAPGFITAT